MPSSKSSSCPVFFLPCLGVSDSISASETEAEAEREEWLVSLVIQLGGEGLKLRQNLSILCSDDI